MAGERTEAPTPRRREDARKRGQVPRSREVDSALVIMAAFAVMRLAGGAMWEGMSALMTDTFAHLGERPLTVEVAATAGSSLMGRALLVLAPLMGGVIAISL